MGNSYMEYPCINIIFDLRHSQDIERLTWALSAQGIADNDYLFWDAITDRKTVVESINASHKMLVKRARNLKMPYVVIAEQDLDFPCVGAWEYFINNKPKDFDVYIGGSYLIDNRVDYKAPLTKVNEWIGNHLIIVHERYYDKFLEVSDTSHIDTVHKDNGEFYLCYPMVAFQRAGWSSNNKAFADYNSALRPEDIWQGVSS